MMNSVDSPSLEESADQKGEAEGEEFKDLVLVADDPFRKNEVIEELSE